MLSLNMLQACEESQLRCPVVFIDEAGLPEERTESLKAKAFSWAIPKLIVAASCPVFRLGHRGLHSKTSWFQKNAVKLANSIHASI